MNNNIKNRIKHFCDSIEKSVRQFENECGLSNGYFKNTTKNISPEYQKKISDIYTDLNMGWLLTGEGSMLKSELSEPGSVKIELPQDILDLLKSQQETIKSQQLLISHLISDNKKTDTAAGA